MSSKIHLYTPCPRVLLNEHNILVTVLCCLELHLQLSSTPCQLKILESLLLCSSPPPNNFIPNPWWFHRTFYAWMCLWSGSSNHRIISVIASRSTLLFRLWGTPIEACTCSKPGHAFRLFNISRQWPPVGLYWQQSDHVSSKSCLN